MHKKVFTKKKLIIIAGIILLAIISFTYFNQKESQLETGIENDTQNFALLSEQRQKYGFPKEVFEELPLPPHDFLELQATGYSNYSFFPKDYYLQPEFYPGFKENAFSHWLNPNPVYHAVNGYAFYPALQKITIKKGETKTTSFFVRSAWGIETYQGAKIIMENNEPALNVFIPNQEVLLGYSYPKFSSDWAKKIDIIITVPFDTTTHDYALNFTAVNPSKEKADEWTNNVSRNYYDIEHANIRLKTTIIVKVID